MMINSKNVVMYVFYVVVVTHNYVGFNFCLEFFDGSLGVFKDAWDV